MEGGGGGNIREWRGPNKCTSTGEGAINIRVSPNKYILSTPAPVNKYWVNKEPGEGGVAGGEGGEGSGRDE